MVICFRCKTEYKNNNRYFECPKCKSSYILETINNKQYKTGVCCFCKYPVIGILNNKTDICLCCRSKCRDIKRLITRHKFNSYQEYLYYRKRLGILSINRKKIYNKKMNSRFLTYYLIKKGIIPHRICKKCHTVNNLVLHHEIYPVTLKDIKSAFNNTIYYVCKECHKKIHLVENNRLSIN